MTDKPEETRVVKDTWDLTLYKWHLETDGLKLMTDGFKDRKVFGRKCPQCGTVYLPGNMFCRKCYIDFDEVVEVGTEGELVTYTATLTDIRGNPIEDPRIAAVVKLDGTDSWMMGEVTGIDWRDLKVGMKLKIKWAEETTGAIADIEGFTPV